MSNQHNHMIYPYVNYKSKIGCKLWVLGKMYKLRFEFDNF